MNYLGNELISRSTRNAARLLIVTSTTVLFAIYLELELVELKVFEVPIGKDKFFDAAIIILSFQLVSFLVLWLGDWFSIQIWNVDGKVSTKNYIFEPTLGNKLSDFERGLENLLAKPDDKPDKIEDLIDEVKKLNRSVKSYSFFALFYVVFWNGALPFVLGMISIYHAYSNA